MDSSRRAPDWDGVIAVELMGGLGNQLFQYAAGRALAERQHSALLLDTHILDVDPKRRYQLDAYAVRGTRVNRSHFTAPGRLRRLVARAGVRTGGLRHFPFDAPRVKESTAHGLYDAAFEQWCSPVILHGYFQSPRYFQAIGPLLRTEFSSRGSMSPDAASIRQQIAAAGAGSCSLHIRRGDYASDPKVREVHGLLGADYYLAAVERLRGLLNQPRFFAFSDDSTVLDELESLRPDCVMVSRPGLADLDELDLMSACQHHIIANSSFSWWGAWLGQPGGVTIAPRRWFASGSEAGIRDRFPSDWHVLG
jgi:hypothetical protein